jgi:hypothetical protein
MPTLDVQVSLLYIHTQRTHRPFVLRSGIAHPTGYRHGSQDHNTVFVTMSLFE